MNNIKNLLILNDNIIETLSITLKLFYFFNNFFNVLATLILKHVYLLRDLKFD